MFENIPSRTLHDIFDFFEFKALSFLNNYNLHNSKAIRNKVEKGHYQNLIICNKNLKKLG